MAATIQELQAAARVLHYRHGSGDLHATRIYANGRVEILAKRYGCRPHKICGRVIGDSVRLYGRQISAKRAALAAYGRAI